MTAQSPSSALWNDLPRRLGTIIIGIPVVVGLLAYCPLLFFQGVHFICAMEYSNMMSVKNYSFVIVSMATATIFHREALLLTCCSIPLFVPRSKNHRFLQGLLVITLPLSVWYEFAQTASHRQLMTLLFISWNADTGALLAGRIYKTICAKTIQQQPQWLINISPAKSLAGIMGGLFVGTLSAMVMGIPPWMWGLVIATLAILGDLVESAMKRQFNQKDSSSLLPGHGGILDRFDSTLFAVLLYYSYIHYQQHYQ